MYLQRVISKKNKNKIVILKVTDKERRFPELGAGSRIRGSGSVPKCHGSGTLINRSVHRYLIKKLLLVLRTFKFYRKNYLLCEKRPDQHAMNANSKYFEYLVTLFLRLSRSPLLRFFVLPSSGKARSMCSSLTRR